MRTAAVRFSRAISVLLLCLMAAKVTAGTNIPVHITAVTVESFADEGLVNISLDDSIEPVMWWVAADSQWRLDFLNTEAGIEVGSVITKNFQGPLKQIWHGKVHENPSIYRVNLYVEPGTGMKVTRTESGLAVRLRADGGGVVAQNGLAPETLLLPGHGGGGVVIDVQRAPVLPLLRELAQNAGISLRMRDNPPAFVNFKTRSDSALCALECLSKRIGMVLTHEGADWWLSAKNNPLLALAAEGTVDTQCLAGMTVSEALHTIGDEQTAERLKRGLSKDKLFAKVSNLPAGLSPRAAAQYLRGEDL